MSRNSPRIDVRQAMAKREMALARHELSAPTAPRIPSGGPVSMAIKAEDPAVRSMVDAFLAKREGAI